MSCLVAAFVFLGTVVLVQFWNLELVLVEHADRGPLTLVRLGRRRCAVHEPSVLQAPSTSGAPLIDAGIAMQFVAANQSAVGAAFTLALPNVLGEPIAVGDAFVRRGFHDAIATVIAKLATHQLPPDATVIDVGAGTGYFAALAAASGVPNVVLFEANARLWPFLRATAFANGWHGSSRWLLHEAAAAGASGDSLELFVPRRRWLLARPFSREDEVSFEPPADTLVRVPGVAIDDVVPASSHVALLVVGAENSELHVLTGAARLLAQCRVRDILLLQLRLSGDVFAKLRGVLALVNRCGYRGFTFEERKEARGVPAVRDERGKWARVLRHVKPWLPGAEWPAPHNLWLHLPASDEERDAMPNQLPESAVASL